MLTRRRLVAALTGGPAVVAAAAATQCTAKPAQAPGDRVAAHGAPDALTARDIILANVMHANGAPNAATHDVMLALNLRLLDKHPDLFEAKYVMRGPVSMIDGRATEARTRMLQVTASLVTFTEAMSEGLAEDFYRILADGVAAEIRHERSILRSRGMVICPYVPIALGGPRMEPKTLAPVMQFQTRYGIWEGALGNPVA